MKRMRAILFLTTAALCLPPASSQAQLRWVIGGNTGFSLFNGSAGFHIGPMGEAFLNKDMSVGSEFSINTQGGTQAVWFNYFKYHFSLQGSKIRPYGDAGFMLDFATGGPYFGMLFGGGANIPVANRISVSPELQMGPIFSYGGGSVRVGPLVYDVKGTTVFVVYIRGGIRYDL